MNLVAKTLWAPLCLLMLLPGCLAPPEASAEVSLKLWPTRFEVLIKEGETAALVVNVQNGCDEPVHLRVYAMDFTVGANGTYHFSEPGHQTYSCSTWISTDQLDFGLAPRETKAVNTTVHVPEQIEPGGHYAAVFFEQAGDPGQGTSVSVGARVACLIYVTVPGVTDADIIAAAEIVQIILPGWIERGPVKVGTLVRNSGNVHLTVAARVYLGDFRGSHAGEVDLGQVIVLPGGERMLEGTWEDLPLFGKVRAKVVIGYHDDHGELVNKEASASFQVVPWKVIMALALPFILTGLAALIIVRKFRFRLKMERRN